MIKIKMEGGFVSDSDAMIAQEQPPSVSKFKGAYMQLAVAMQAKNSSISAKLLAEAMLRAAVDLMSDAAGRAEAAALIRGVADELERGQNTTGKTR